MPLPWLIGAAVFAGVAALVKTATDDSSSSTSTDGEAERREQEREAKLERKRQRLETNIATIEENQLEHARNYLVRAAEALGKDAGARANLTAAQLDKALKAKAPASSEYAKAMSSALNIDGDYEQGCTRTETDSFLVNLQVLDSLPSGSASSVGKPAVKPSARHMAAILDAQQSVLAGFFGGLTGPLSVTALSDSEREDLAALSAAANRLERLLRLKNAIEQQA